MVTKEIIAIDPDIDLSGVAIYKPNVGLSYSKQPFPQLIEYLKGGSDKMVVIEGGWLNHKVNFHGGNYNVAQRIAHNVGENHAIGKTLVKCCEFYKIPHVVIKPLTKYWSGKDKKITNDELNRILRHHGYAPLKRSNQDERDALLILLTYMNTL